MTATFNNPVALAQALVRCQSVTPIEGGALRLLEQVLAPAGFHCHRLPFSAPDTPDVDNLFARIGGGGPHLCFAGHTDVVPPGDVTRWTHPPFGAVIADGFLYGRGAVDMKGNIACFLAATLDFLSDPSRLGQGSISFLITGDEEGPAVNGTVKVLDWMAAHGHTPSACLVGEPSNPERLGDAIKIGRRGSLNGRLVVRGKQGHSAYPHVANNPIRGLARVASALQSLRLDDGTDTFAPSNLEIVAIETGNPAYNVIPAVAELRLNVRYNDRHTFGSLETLLHKTALTALDGSGLELEASFHGNADAFVTKPGPLVDTMVAAIRSETGRSPELSTSGGTSDARFVKDYCQVIEFGLVNKTIHAVDERVAVADLGALTSIYRSFLDRYFAVAVA
jgi:succinyl-diaminopimelate desuccinylase